MRRSAALTASLLLAAPILAGEPAPSPPASLRACEPAPGGALRCATRRADGGVREWWLERDGVRTGALTHLYPDGSPAWRETSGPDGFVLLEEWHPNGRLAERRERIPAPADAALPLVSSRRWYENGRLHWEGTFELGPTRQEPRLQLGGVEMVPDWSDAFVGMAPHGRFRRFRDDGSPWADFLYEHGLRRGPQRRFHASGVVAQEWSANERVELSSIVDAPGGPWASFYADGRPRERGSYRAGRRIGLWRAYHRNGVVAEETRYDDAGREQGTWRRFDLGGRLVGEIVFEHGKRRSAPAPCPADAELCGTWPEAQPLPPLQLRPAASALACPLELARSGRHSETGIPIYLGRIGPEGRFVGRWCELAADGAIYRQGEATATGEPLRTTTLFYENGDLHQQLERTPGVFERTVSFDYDCACKRLEVVKHTSSSDEEMTLWQPTGLLAERGVRRASGARHGRWTFWGADGRVSHWIDYVDGEARRRIDD